MKVCVCVSALLRVSDAILRERRSIARSAAPVITQEFGWQLPKSGKVRRCERLERGSRCSAEFSRQLDESLSTDDEGVPCSRVLVESPSLSSVASERGVLGPCAMSLFDILISGGEDAASSSGRTSCARDSLASSAVSEQ